MGISRAGKSRAVLSLSNLYRQRGPLSSLACALAVQWPLATSLES
jgi:hypothetical protein